MTATGEPEALLRRLAAADERALEAVLSPAAGGGAQGLAPGSALDRSIRELVRLAALLAVGAPATSLRWAAELAMSTGVTADAVVAVLAVTAGPVGAVQVVANAPRLALALDIDTDTDTELASEIQLDALDGS